MITNNRLGGLENAAGEQYDYTRRTGFFVENMSIRVAGVESATVNAQATADDALSRAGAAQHDLNAYKATNENDMNQFRADMLDECDRVEKTATEADKKATDAKELAAAIKRRVSLMVDKLFPRQSPPAAVALPTRARRPRRDPRPRGSRRPARRPRRSRHSGRTARAASRRRTASRSTSIRSTSLTGGASSPGQAGMESFSGFCQQHLSVPCANTTHHLCYRWIGYGSPRLQIRSRGESTFAHEHAQLLVLPRSASIRKLWCHEWRHETESFVYGLFHWRIECDVCVERRISACIASCIAHAPPCTTDT